MLNRNTRQFGKKHLFDQNEETCWNSDQVRNLPGPSTRPVNQIQGPGCLENYRAPQLGSVGLVRRDHVLNPPTTNQLFERMHSIIAFSLE